MGFTCRPIGVIRSPHKEADKTPIQSVFAEGVPGRLELEPEYEDGLQSIEGFSYIHVIYPFDRAGPPKLLVRPFLDDSPRGVFATRAPARPNALGLSLLRLIKRDGRVLHVSDVDILDGTPLLDIKPYVTRFDARSGALCGWSDAVDESAARAIGSREAAGPEGDKRGST